MKKMISTSLLVLLSTLTRGLLLIVFAMLSFIGAYAQTPRTSTGSGDWNTASTWTPAGVPGTSDDATILAGHTVTVAANATCRRLFISGTVNMTGSGITMDITTNSIAGNTNGLQLNSGGSLTIGATNILYFSNTQASGIVNNGGTIVSTGTNGINGGTIRANTNSGGQFGVSGTASTTIYNLEFLGNADFRIMSGGLLVNGTLSEVDNNFTATNTTLSPVYGPASTLSISNNNQGISGGTPLNNPLNKLWSAQTGTIGVTPGYPNNVTLRNMGTSSGGVNVPPNINVGWRPAVGATIGLNGTLRIGNGTAGLPNDNPTGSLNASLDQIASLNCGGIIVDNNSTLIGPPAGATFIDRGNFTLQGATTGLFYSMGAVINFAGSGTVGSPQIISTTDASGVITFGSMTVSNGTYVRLDDDVNVPGTLTLTSGYVGTSATNSLNVTNTANTAIVGGSSTAYIDGPLNWSLPATTTGNYVFPIGDLSGGAYLPLTLSSANSSGGTVVTAEGINTNSFGIPDLSISAISQTEYWSLSTTNPFSGSTVVDATRPMAVAPYNALGTSSAVNGVYHVAGGSPSGTSIIDGGIGSSSPIYITMVTAFLSPVRLGGALASVNGSCAATNGSLIVGGVGGTSPYSFSITSAVAGFVGPGTSATFTNLAQGPHMVWIKDATNTVRSAELHVLGAVQINGNDQDVDICAGSSTTLTASNLQNSSATYTWSPATGLNTTSGATVIASPTVATTYTVTSTIYANNLLTNGSFEGGLTPSGFTPTYTAHAGGYGTTPGSGGFYKLASAGNSLCTFFTGLAAQDGSTYFIADGNTASTDVFSLAITGLTTGTVYRFSFWYAEGSNDIDPLLRTQANGITLGTVTVDNYLGWTQANYSFTAIAGTNTITFRNMLAPGNTNGNDFYIDNMQLLAPCTVSASIDITVNCTLPVELLTFNAVRKGEGALLTWSTSSEINSSHFIVERSVDGVSFSPIGQPVPAAGNSSELLNYYLIDPSIALGVTYYRLAQYDLDGTMYYSEIRAVSKDGVDGVLILPNPNNGIFSIVFDNNGDFKSRVSIVNSLGQLVFEENESTAKLMNVDISDFASGVYYLQVSTEDEMIVKKVVKE